MQIFHTVSLFSLQISSTDTDSFWSWSNILGRFWRYNICFNIIWIALPKFNWVFTDAMYVLFFITATLLTTWTAVVKGCWCALMVSLYSEWDPSSTGWNYEKVILLLSHGPRSLHSHLCQRDVLWNICNWAGEKERQQKPLLSNKREETILALQLPRTVLYQTLHLVCMLSV